MGILNYIKKKKYAKIKWDQALFTVSRTDSFDKADALNALCKAADIGLMAAKKFLESKEPASLPITDYRSFWKIDAALSAVGGILQVFLNNSQLDKAMIPETEEDAANAAEFLAESGKSAEDYEAHPDDPDECDYYPDESEEPLIDYATGEIIEKK